MPVILTLRLDQVLFQKLNKAKQQFQDLSKEQAGWRIKEKALRSRDLFANLLEAKDPESLRRLTEEELIAESGILIISGADTMATTMAATLFYCLHYPSALRRLYSEIRDAFSDLEAVRMGEQMNSCTFSRSCLNETMRLTPPVSALLPREILAGGLIVDGKYFPEGTNIGLPHYALHHDERIFADPFHFKPERWMVATDTKDIKASEAEVALMNSAVCALGVGRASCVGKILAY